MLDILVKGGPVMIPLLFCSVLAVAVSLERLWYLYSTRVDSEDLMDEVKLALSQGKLLEAVQIAKRSRGQVAALVATGIAYSDRPRDELREVLDEVGRAEVFKMEQRLVLLDAVATISPLLGLLGTVTGIIRTFNILGALQGLGSPQDLSSGIAEALITTAAGLIIAIPSMAMYQWISSIIDRRVADMNRRSGELMEALATLRGE
ncbi:MAG TPA: MotA/TolQ/ExbB proton channel family protein [Limnochordales bacterium]|nr:MotA/TolQ/ExbB proton channel family protein [Limnochordales bacterium]